MNPQIKKQIEEEALRRFPEDDSYLCRDRDNSLLRQGFTEGSEYGYNIKESVNEKLDFYAMDLNTERIKTYTALSERYNLDISSIRDIFDAGLNFAAGKYESKLSTSNQENNDVWISVEDRLPEGDEYGIVIGWSVKFGNPDRSAGGFMVLVYFDNCWRKDSDDSAYEDNPDYQKITHWIPLPNPPKEK